MVKHRRILRSATLALLASVAVTATAAAQKRTSGIDTSNFDRSIRPQDDFFRYVNGGWLKKTPIKGDATGAGAFQELSERSRNGMHELFEAAAKSPAPAGDQRPSVKVAANGPDQAERAKIGDLYASYMDSARVERLGVKPLAGEMQAIAALTSSAQLPATLAHFARIGIQGPIGVNVGQDPKASSVNIVLVTQSGLGMPDRDYYLRSDAKTVATRAKYVEYLTRMFTLAGQADALGAAQRVLALETEIAAKQWDRARSRDRNATYNKMSVADLGRLTPSYDWSTYLDAAGLAKATDVIVRQPDYLAAMDTIMKATPPATWRDYLTAKLLDATADELPSAFVQARFDFRGVRCRASRRWRRAGSAR